MEVWDEKKIGRQNKAKIERLLTWKDNKVKLQLRLLFCAFMSENWMTKMAENWEITDKSRCSKFFCT